MKFKFKLGRENLESIILITICSISLYSFTRCNSNNDLLNYYHNSNKMCYYVLMLIYTIFTLGIVYNSKYILKLIGSHVFKIVKTKSKKIFRGIKL